MDTKTYLHYIFITASSSSPRIKLRGKKNICVVVLAAARENKHEKEAAEEGGKNESQVRTCSSVFCSDMKRITRSMARLAMWIALRLPEFAIIVAHH